jgi:TolA-binding protein
MSSPCPRLFEVEALRDGRLLGVERTRFEQHLETCAACRKEAAAIERLGTSLQLATNLPRNELHVRRERTRLLESFDRSLLGAGRAHAPRNRWVWWSAAAATLVACLALVFATDLGRQPPTAAIQAVHGATWSREVTEDWELVRLSQGELRIQVNENEQKVPLRVELPDGELEDIGTTFTVLVENGRTTRVVVEEGLVLLRLRGNAPLTLAAGRTWTPTASLDPSARPTASALRSPDPIAAPTEPSVAAPTEPSVAAPTEPRAPAPRDTTSPRETGTAPPVQSQKPSSDESPSETPSPRDSASEAFSAAVARLDAGEPKRAAQEFSRFIEHYPGDARVEDAAYLRVLALQRSGNADATRAAAQQYLRRHPSGFRRTEVEKLAR